MEISDFIGFIVSVLVFPHLHGKTSVHPEPGSIPKKSWKRKNEQETLKSFLKSLNVEMDDLDDEEEGEGHAAHHVEKGCHASSSPHKWSRKSQSPTAKWRMIFAIRPTSNSAALKQPLNRGV